MNSDQAQPEGIAVGEALRRLRAARGHTLEACAAYVRRHAGLPWNRDTVVTLEHGRRETITLRDLVGLSMAYDVPLDYWFDGPGDIYVSDTVAVSKDALRRSLRGDRLPRQAGLDAPDDLGFSERRGTGRPKGLPHLPAPGHGTAPRPLTEQEVRSLPLAKAFNISPEVAHGVAEYLWGHSIEDERDLRIGDTSTMSPGTLRARRGNMTRLLIAEAGERAFSQPPGAELQAGVQQSMLRTDARILRDRIHATDKHDGVTSEPGPPAK